MGFLDNVKDALRGAVSGREPKNDTSPQAPTEAPAEAPTPVEEKPAPEPYDTYTVKTGDTIGSICARMDVSYQEITRINKIENPDLIFPGQVFLVPRKK